MKYYVVRADITAKGSEEKEVKSFEDYDSALKFYHLCFSNNINQEKKVCTMLTDEDLNPIKQESWEEKDENANQ